MICIIAGNELEAKNWAYGQMLQKWEWFYPHDFEDLNRRKDFHVLVVGTAGQNVPSQYFEQFLSKAHERGRMK